MSTFEDFVSQMVRDSMGENITASVIGAAVDDPVDDFADGPTYDHFICQNIDASVEPAGDSAVDSAGFFSRIYSGFVSLFSKIFQWF